MPLYAQDHHFAMPTPAHTQTAGAREAVESMIRIGHERRIRRELAGMVTNHGRPPVVPYDADPVTATARRMLATADAHGWKTNLVTLTDRCAVEGVRGTVAFRAVWVRGEAAGARWHER